VAISLPLCFCYNRASATLHNIRADKRDTAA
jgi:hypothetical protein